MIGAGFDRAEGWAEVGTTSFDLNRAPVRRVSIDSDAAPSSQRDPEQFRSNRLADIADEIAVQSERQTEDQVAFPELVSRG